jgi:hypothetical protein
MEYLEGESLEQRLNKGPLAFDNLIWPHFDHYSLAPPE